MRTKKHQVNFWAEVEVWKELKRLAAEDGESLSDYVRAILRRHVEDNND